MTSPSKTQNRDEANVNGRINAYSHRHVQVASALAKAHDVPSRLALHQH